MAREERRPAYLIFRHSTAALRRECRYAERVAVTRVSRLVHRGYGRTEWKARNETPNCADLPRTRPCPTCGGPALVAELLSGTFNPDKKCGPRCMGATGPTCDCGCAGANHGASFDGGGGI